MKSAVVYRINLVLLTISLGALIAGSSQFENLRLYAGKTFNRELHYRADRYAKLRLKGFPGQSVVWSVEAASSLQRQWASSQGLTLLLMNPNTGYQNEYAIPAREQDWTERIVPVDTSASPAQPVILSGTIRIPSDFAAQTLEGRLVGSISYPVPAVPPPSFLTTDRAVTIYEDVAIPARLEVVPYNQRGMNLMVAGLAGLIGTIVFGLTILSRVVRRNGARWRVAIAEKAIVTFVKVVAPFTQPDPREARHQLAAGTLVTSFERVSPALARDESVSLKKENLKQLLSSGLLDSWVRGNKGTWSHQEWLELLGVLEASEFWPVEPNAVGAALEELKREFREMPFTGISDQQPMLSESVLVCSASA